MKKKAIVIGVLIILLTFVVLYFDFEITKAMSFIKGNLIDNFFIGINFISSKIILFFLATIFFLWKKDKRRILLPLWFTMGLSVITSFLLKVMVQRPRPFQLEIISLPSFLEEASHSIWNFSFPSFHAMLTFCVLPFISKAYPKLKYVWIIFAGIVVFARIYLGLHFLSDIIAGGAIGYLLGVIILKYEEENKYFEKIQKKIFKS